MQLDLQHLDGKRGLAAADGGSPRSSPLAPGERETGYATTHIFAPDLDGNGKTRRPARRVPSAASSSASICPAI
ncbi:MAG: hypothetical protein V9F00_17640 [Nocardioides sp.]